MQLLASHCQIFAWDSVHSVCGHVMHDEPESLLELLPSSKGVNWSSDEEDADEYEDVAVVIGGSGVDVVVKTTGESVVDVGGPQCIVSKVLANNAIITKMRFRVVIFIWVYSGEYLDIQYLQSSGEKSRRLVCFSGDVKQNRNKRCMQQYLLWRFCCRMFVNWFYDFLEQNRDYVI